MPYDPQPSGWTSPDGGMPFQVSRPTVVPLTGLVSGTWEQPTPRIDNQDDRRRQHLLRDSKQQSCGKAPKGETAGHPSRQRKLIVASVCESRQRPDCCRSFCYKIPPVYDFVC